MSFFRQREIYPDALPSLGRGVASAPPRTHRNEFPAGYSSASCTPAWLASASPAKFILQAETKSVKLKSANSCLSLLSVSQQRGALQSVPFFSLCHGSGDFFIWLVLLGLARIWEFDLHAVLGR